jgi:hypothetical protein
MALLRFLAAAAALAMTLALSPASARADDPPDASVATVPHPHAYGIFVGTNVGGPGQAPLRYAEEDARRVAQVLRDLGRYGQADLRVLVRPDPRKVLTAVDDVTAKLRAHEARGEQAVLVFYYSGHAKANAFNLGAEELPIATLRARLDRAPTTLTLIVLDACQSGQFARTKGAEPAADFSFNSVSRLTTKGTVVMASSAAQELSQESDELRSSYFTHHLVVALRGAADTDGDGRVSLDEAYRYAYQRTLTSTAETQVGGQHVTLETDLAGQGDLAVTYPAAARSHLELPAALEGRVLVQHRASGNVVAEVQKGRGTKLKLAFAAGLYDAIVSETVKTSRVLRCKLSLTDGRTTSLDLGGCVAVRRVGTAKGDRDTIASPGGGRPIDPWTVEVGAGFMGRTDDAFTRRLAEFGYEPQRSFLGIDPRGRASVAFYKGLLPHLSIGGQLTTLSGDTYQRSAGDSDDEFSFGAYGAGAFAQLSTTPIGRSSPRSTYLELYGRLGGGLTMGTATLTTGSTLTVDRERSTEVHWGYLIGGAAGLAVVAPRYVSFFLQGGYDYAPTIANLVGDTHDGGGPSAQLGVRLRFEERP